MGFHKNAGIIAMSASLIALYLLVKNPGGVSTLITQGPTGASNIIKAFQGR